MRGRISVVFGLLAGVAFLAAPAGMAGEKGSGLKVEGEVTKDDPKDNLLKKSYAKGHTFKMQAGRWYKIDLMSKDFDTFLRLEDPSGQMVAFDDDGRSEE